MTTQHFDVLIVGAGLSGIGAAVHLQKHCPGHSYAILEGREQMGGTWDLFKYPGIRSDSDMYTLGYSFKPWKHGKAIAHGSTILNYIQETAHEYGVEQKIRYGHRVVQSDWSSATNTWTLTVQVDPQGEKQTLSCNFLWLCAGYYNYDQGYQPDFKGVEQFKGRLIHPQKWDTALDYTDKNVVIIGSGATAVTLLPAMTDKARHVTMLQRSPSYIANRPQLSPFEYKALKWLPSTLAYHAIRWKNIAIQMIFYRLSKKDPEKARRMLIGLLRRELPKGYDVKKHFTPNYNPWDQRVCAVPDNDLFKVISEGKASVVTDHIEHFTETGIKLKSGEELQADIVVSATGLNLQAFGGAHMRIDGQEVKLNEKYSYKGMMISDIPNMVFVIGYTNSSWTLKADLVSRYTCRLLNLMKRKGHKQVVPRMTDHHIRPQPIIDFASGYVQRAVEQFPKQGEVTPWKLHQNYLMDMMNLKFGKVKDGVVEFS